MSYIFFKIILLFIKISYIIVLVPLSRINYGNVTNAIVELPHKIRRSTHENFIYISDINCMKDYGRVVIERFPGTTISDQVKATLPENDRSKPLEIILLPKSDQKTRQSPQENQKLPKIIEQLFEKNNSGYFPGDDQLSRSRCNKVLARFSGGSPVVLRRFSEGSSNNLGRTSGKTSENLRRFYYFYQF